LDDLLHTHAIACTWAIFDVVKKFSCVANALKSGTISNSYKLISTGFAPCRAFGLDIPTNAHTTEVQLWWTTNNNAITALGQSEESTWYNNN
jgi:hypothetical protein